VAASSGKSKFVFIQPKQLLWRVSDAARQYRQQQTLNATAAMGRRGEDLAHRFLQQSGFVVICRNYRTSGGDAEIDIVARDNGTLVFVEVKSRASAEFGAPERAIDPEKQQKIMRAAKSYVTRAGANWNEVRFDTVSVVFSRPPSIVHHQDVFFQGRAH
jgi:putative endonuclease